MDDLRYFGTYARFDTVSKKEAAQLVGADNLVGDLFSIEFDEEERSAKAWLVNRFGAKVGFLDPAISRRLSICQARAWTLRAYLSFIAFTDSPEPGHYWGQVALICNDSHFDDAVDAFARRVADLMSEGIRPDVDLGERGVDAVIANDGTWMTEVRTPFPDKVHGTVIMKKRRKMSEKMIEEGRKGNKGCYVVSWAFIIIVVAAIIYGLHAIGLF